MDILSVFEWFAQESLLAAEVATDPVQREVWLRLCRRRVGMEMRHRPIMVTDRLRLHYQPAALLAVGGDCVPGPRLWNQKTASAR